MKDRVAANPNRYAVYDDDHNFLRYEYHERADNPTEVGTPLSKGTLLADATAAALGLTGDPTVNDGLAVIASTLIARETVTGSYTGTGTYGVSNPNSLTFDSAPSLLIIVAPENTEGVARYANILIVNGVLRLFGSYGGMSMNVTTYAVLDGGKTVQWYANTPGNQFNASGIKYDFIALM